MERKIGEIFEYKGEWYQCVEGLYCDDCSFVNDNCEDRERITLREKLTKQPTTGFCNSEKRNDRKSVIFKKLEKVGQPYTTYVNKIVQNYLLETAVSVPPKVGFTLINNEQRLIAIEIKRKEDMEEKKVNLDKLVTDYTSNKITYNEFEKAVKELYADKEEIKPALKEFDLEAAKAGKPVCTRDGREARIICFDRDWDMHIVALVSDPLGESVHYYLSNGKVDFDKQNDEDLMMLPEKKEGWVNVYKNQIHDTFESAEEGHKGTSDYLKTIRVEWEE